MFTNLNFVLAIRKTIEMINCAKREIIRCFYYIIIALIFLFCNYFYDFNILLLRNKHWQMWMLIQFHHTIKSPWVQNNYLLYQVSVAELFKAFAGS